MTTPPNMTRFSRRVKARLGIRSNDDLAERLYHFMQTAPNCPARRRVEQILQNASDRRDAALEQMSATPDKKG